MSDLREDGLREASKGVGGLEVLADRWDHR